MSPEALSHAAIPDDELTLHIKYTAMAVWEEDALKVNRLIGHDVG
jgi:hypothetical protein